jgi:hypothetical protein
MDAFLINVAANYVKFTPYMDELHYFSMLSPYRSSKNALITVFPIGIKAKTRWHLADFCRSSWLIINFTTYKPWGQQQ